MKTRKIWKKKYIYDQIYDKNEKEGKKPQIFHDEKCNWVVFVLIKNGNFTKFIKETKSSAFRGLWILDTVKYIKLYAVKETNTIWTGICSMFNEES